MNNRQAGRRRGRGGQRPQGGGGTPNRQDNGNRIDSRARGNAAQLLEKYKNLARDAQMAGDRVNIEYYLQFADHYFRVLSETRTRFEEGNQQRRPQNDVDEEEEFDLEGQGDIHDFRDPRDDRPARQNGRDNDNGREQGDRQPQREQGSREQGGRDQGPREQGNRENGREQNGAREPQDREPRAQRGRDGNGRDRDQSRDQNREQPREEARESYREARREPRAEPVRQAPVAQDEAPALAVAAEEAPRRRGRPRRQPVDAVAQPASNETAHDDGGHDTGIEIDRLPPSLGFTGDAADEPAEKPRRRRRVRGEEEVVPPAE